MCYYAVFITTVSLINRVGALKMASQVKYMIKSNNLSKSLTALNCINNLWDILKNTKYSLIKEYEAIYKILVCCRF